MEAVALPINPSAWGPGFIDFTSNDLVEPPLGLMIQSKENTKTLTQSKDRGLDVWTPPPANMRAGSNHEANLLPLIYAAEGPIPKRKCFGLYFALEFSKENVSVLLLHGLRSGIVNEMF